MMWTDSRGDAVQMDVPVMEAMESRLLLSTTVDLVNGKAFTYIEADGDRVTVKLTGGGSGVITFEGELGSAVESLVVDPNVNGKSKLTISVKKAKKTGDGSVEIGELTVNGVLASLKAPKVDFVGNLTMDVGRKASIVVGNMFESTMTLSGEASTVSVRVGVLFNSEIIAADSAVALQVSWAMVSNVRAFTFAKITVKSDYIGGAITAAGVNAKGVSIGGINMKGTLDATITAPGAITGITALEISGGSVTADSLGKLVVKGQKPKRKNSFISLDGDMLATIELAGENVGAKNTLGSTSVKGTLGGDVTVTGNAATITMKNLTANLTVSGKAAVRTQDVLSTTRPDEPAGEIHLGSGSVRSGRVTTRYAGEVDLFVVVPVI